MLRRQAVSPRVPRGDESSAPQARPNLSMRPEGALLTPSKRGASQPPILFSAAQPPRPFWAAPTSVGVRRREPLGGATGVYSIKRGPHCAARSGEQRERARGIDTHCPTRSAKGPLDPHNRGASAEAQCGTAPRAARDLTGEPCSPVNPLFLDGGFFRRLSWGSRGPFALLLGR